MVQSRFARFLCAFAALAIFTLVLSGCSAQKPMPTDPTDPAVITVQAIGAVAGMGCGYVRLNRSPEDVAKARLSAAAAKTVLTSPTPDLDAIQAALIEGFDQNDAAFITLIVAEIRNVFGVTGVIQSGTAPYVAVDTLISRCQAALGVA